MYDGIIIIVLRDLLKHGLDRMANFVVSTETKNINYVQGQI